MTTHRSGEPTQLLIETVTPGGQKFGLLKDSVVTCENLATVTQDRVTRTIGTLPDDSMGEINACLKESLGIA